MLTQQFHVNGKRVESSADPMERLSVVLRDEFALTGTKVGCDAGDCGACTVVVDGEQVCACLTPVAQVNGSQVLTVEGLEEDPKLIVLQRAFEELGAAQCGICTPGMLLAASTLFRNSARVSDEDIRVALGGVLCRCTGYQKIIAAVRAALDDGLGETGVDVDRPAMGRRLLSVDGAEKVSGKTLFGADTIPENSLHLRVVRSPYAHARFVLGDTAKLHTRYPGLACVLSARHVPGTNAFGVYPDLKDQPVLADGLTRFRGEAVLAIVGDNATVATMRDNELPLIWEPLVPIDAPEQALLEGAAPINPARDDNVLAHGRVYSGAIAAPPDSQGFVETQGEFVTHFVEHAYIEPEAGYAQRLGTDRIEVVASTQSPYMDRAEIAYVLGIAPTQVRVRPTACGGGFGGKLDQSVQPLIALAAWLLDRPVRCVYTRTESMAATTKRHPAQIRARAVATRSGELVSYEFDGQFNTGAYSSWGPTVAGRVPVHCMGPYRVPNVRADARAIFTHRSPSGAFRGFGVPQAALAHEALMDELADSLAIDKLEFRYTNALRAGDTTATGQTLHASAGLPACLNALRPHWAKLNQAAKHFNETNRRSHLRRGVGIACMWYGCGNTSMSNPSRMRVTISQKGIITFHNGAQDIGQGSSTVLTQIMADAIGIAPCNIQMILSDTDLTDDAGKSSASRQTYVSGRATQLAGDALRGSILQLANVGPDAKITVIDANIMVTEGDHTHTINLQELPLAPGEDEGIVMVGRGEFDPSTTILDENGQGIPYATYGFAAQIASVDVDIELGCVYVREIVAAHDVGAAVNPTLVEGQIEGGIAQGLGLALMEEFVPGRTENLHDYLIPTVGDIPKITSIIIEDAEPTGPYGAKGIGEPALVPTAPAILGAVNAATGVRMRQLPILPDRVRAALAAGDNHDD
ncbi:MAG: molybdopterin-dependent oxidoreductase [Chromatiales bacterium]|jgi:aldehyde oxidoreductase|nr:molybdopterin-dependent oxidoreductase [Chromatiales bacterium]